jgi:hypothetical protein
MDTERSAKEPRNEFNPDTSYAQILMEVPSWENIDEIKKVIEDFGVHVIEWRRISPNSILLKLSVKDMRSITLKLAEQGFSIIKGVNALL